jgi:ribosome assembly protein 1
LYARKLGVKREVLQKTLWGEYYFNSKTKKIYKKNFNGKMVPMFVQFVLNNIWEVYSAAESKYGAKRGAIDSQQGPFEIGKDY